MQVRVRLGQEGLSSHDATTRDASHLRYHVALSYYYIDVCAREGWNISDKRRLLRRLVL